MSLKAEELATGRVPGLVPGAQGSESTTVLTKVKWINVTKVVRSSQIPHSSPTHIAAQPVLLFIISCCSTSSKLLQADYDMVHVVKSQIPTHTFSLYVFMLQTKQYCFYCSCGINQELQCLLKIAHTNKSSSKSSLKPSNIHFFPSVMKRMPIDLRPGLSFQIRSNRLVKRTINKTKIVFRATIHKWVKQSNMSTC